MNKEAMTLALEALNNSVDLVVEDAYNAEKLYGNYPTRQAKVGGLKALAEDHKKAIKALEEVLAKQEQGEPVAYVVTTEVHGQMCSFIHRSDLTELLPDGQLLYTTPQPAQKPLTYEQAMDAYCETPPFVTYKEAFIAGIRFIEAAHGIKEKNT